jgi:iron-sulfur cluster repair protein YtfE (RIC family)
VSEAPDEPGRHLFEELQWVHEKIRHDLAVCEDLAQRVAEGLSPEQVRAEIRELQTNSPLWKLRVNCLYYCRFVHSHHHAEDVLLFPALRASDPAMVPVADKLEADHRVVSDLLDEVEAAADALLVEDAVDIRARIIKALGDLRVELIAHLAYEEEAAGPTIRSWTSWPFY